MVFGILFLLIVVGAVSLMLAVVFFKLFLRCLSLVLALVVIAALASAHINHIDPYAGGIYHDYR